MHTQNKSPITHFVLSGICVAILAACGSSNGGGDSPKNLSVAPKNNVNKDDAKKTIPTKTTLVRIMLTKVLPIKTIPTRLTLTKEIPTKIMPIKIIKLTLTKKHYY